MALLQGHDAPEHAEGAEEGFRLRIRFPLRHQLQPFHKVYSHSRACISYRVSPLKPAGAY